MYIEEDELNEENLPRPAEIRHSRAAGPRSSTSSHCYVSEGFVQYSQPSLNGIPHSIYQKL